MTTSTRGSSEVETGAEASNPSGPRNTRSTTTARRRKGAAIHVFSIGGHRFRCSRDNLIDTLMDGLSWIVEGMVYLIGPLLILLALSIISLLTYTFVTILLPMIQAKHQDSVLQNIYVGFHCAFVVFLLVNVLFNYYYCVVTRHAGPRYDKLVRELAEAMQIPYPETPAQLAQYRRDFEDRMVLRMRRRQARAEVATAATSQQQQQQEQQQVVQAIPAAAAAAEGAVTQRKHHPVNNTTNSNPPARSHQLQPSQQQQQQQQRPVRGWMILGPFEWGYCGNSNQPKPPRSHYDHVSKKLVLNLDHYCPWMFNAIGYFNYRYFVNFLIYIFLGMLYGSAISLEPFLLLDSKEYRQQIILLRQSHGGPRPERILPMLPYRDEKILLSLCFMLCMAVGVAVLMLGGFHIYLTLTAQTTVEFHGNFANRKRANQVGQKWQNPYSAGSFRANFEQVFGRTSPWFLALLPSTREPECFPFPVPGHGSKRRQKLYSSSNGSSCTQKEQPLGDAIV